MKSILSASLVHASLGNYRAMPVLSEPETEAFETWISGNVLFEHPYERLTGKEKNKAPVVLMLDSEIDKLMEMYDTDEDSLLEGEVDGTYFFMGEYVEGNSFKKASYKKALDLFFGKTFDIMFEDSFISRSLPKLSTKLTEKNKHTLNASFQSSFNVCTIPSFTGKQLTFKTKKIFANKANKWPIFSIGILQTNSKDVVFYVFEKQGEFTISPNSLEWFEEKLSTVLSFGSSTFIKNIPTNYSRFSKFKITHLTDGWSEVTK